MTQPLEENRLYSSWSRTPGKPSSSSNFINTKISNISSSTDSGVGRTPNWNSDSENKFALYDSNLWSNSNTLSSSDINDNSKKPLWDDNTKSIGNNYTLGFSSQWPTNNDIVPWGITRNNSTDFLVNNNDSSNKLDNNSWNNSQSIDSSNDRFMTRSISIWAANQAESSSNSVSTIANNMDNPQINGQFQIVDSISKSSSKIISKSIQLQSEMDKSEFSLFSAFNNTAVNDVGTTDDDNDINNSEPNSNAEKNCEHQTWAQAAGKGLQNCVKVEDCVKHEVDEQFLSLINRIDGWGSHTVDQSTPWVFENESCGGDSSEMKIGSLSCSSQSGQRNNGRSAVESNVWTNEPPNGVGVWESHYENIGERTSRWGGSGGGTAASAATLGGGGVPSCQKSKSSGTGWGEMSPMTDNQWPADRDENSVWSSSNAGTNTATNNQQKQSWGGMLATIGKQDPAASSTPIGSGNRNNNNNNSSSNTVGAGNGTNSSIISSQQRNSNAQPSAITGTSGGSLVIPPSGDMNDPAANNNNRHSFYSNHQNVAMMPNNNRMVPSTKSKQIMNIGFRKDDSQNNMFNNSLEINRPFMDMKNPSQLNHSNMLGSRSDWNMPHDNFRVNPTESDNGVMFGSGYLPQSMITTNNNQPLKPQHMMQHIQQMPMGNRLPSENHLFLEKQIITEITQLQTKQQDLLQRIHGLRSIAGSQAFIQEMTRTLNEVRQQLNTQQTTLKVIRSQMSMVNNQMPNGIMNNNSNNNLLPIVSRTIQPSASGVQSQSQSGLASDLSAQMNELKLQKSRMDLWSQGNLPSPNTISPYMGADKPSGFYNPSIPNGGPMPPQSFNNFNRNSQFNCIPTHRTPNQMWQSRMMQNSNSAAASTSANAFNAGTDSHSIINGPNINDEMDSISNNGLNNSNSSTNSKLQITSNCASDTTGNNNNNSTANSASTTALSLSQTLPSSIGSRVSSAFSSSRDISHISANISEFVPGQPWPGISYSQRDDPNVTLGAGPRSLLSITNDHLEKLANSSVNSINGPNDVGSNSTVNRLPNNLNGVCSTANRTNMMTYVLIRDLPSHINVEMLKNVLTPMNFPGLIHMHPNLVSRWVLLHFTSNEEALKAYKNLHNNKVGVVELLPDQEVNQVIRGHRNNGIIDHPMF